MSTTRLSSICLSASIPNLRYPSTSSRNITINRLRNRLRDLLDIFILRNLCSLVYDRSNRSRDRLLCMLHLVFHLFQDFRVLLDCHGVALQEDRTVYPGDDERKEKDAGASYETIRRIILVLGLGGFGGGVVGKCFVSLSDGDGGGLIREL